MIDREKVLADGYRSKLHERKAKLVRCKTQEERIKLVYGWIIQRVFEFNNFKKLISFLIELEKEEICQRKKS
jgi:hypothetical protein